ncbi:MAG: hypothetical protein KatS3mg004_3510 [Bryobacteraceae bacterium]|nr:MAG: hypothetical protein KatS3mg004_3510 [Bryobacteraceae bacterium]
MDLFPTLCDVGGVAKEEWLQGRSMMSLVRGESAEIRERLTGEVTFHAAYEPQRTVRSKRWADVRRFGTRRTPVLPKCDDGPGKSLWLDHGRESHRLEEEALYDLAFDPLESHNVLAQNPGVAAHWRGVLEQWMKETDDPPLRGDVPPPPGVRVDDADGINPREKPVQYD